MDKAAILIVENEAIVAADLAGKLRQLGYEVAGVVAGGEDAVALALSLRPHLVLMDIRLGGSIDGIEAAQAIRREHDVPVVYLTAHSDASTLARAKLTGPFGYILKPFEERDLATQIELALYRHQAERQIREQREWLRVTLTSIGDAVIATDGSGRINFLNPVAESLTGWKAGEAVGQSMTSVVRMVNEQTGQAVEEPFAQVLREGSGVALANHASLVTRDGRTVPVEDSAAPILDASGQVIGAVLVFHDVTEKRRAEEALREAERKYRELVRYAPAAIYEIDFRNKRFTSVNEAMTHMAGYSREELLGMNPFELTDEEGQARFQARIAKWLKGEEPDRNVEYKIQTKNGQTLDMVLDVTFTADENGKPLGATVVGHDITERKRMEAALRKSRDELELRVRERTAELAETNEAIEHQKERFRLITETIQDVFWMSTPGIQKMLYVNPAYEKIWGKTRESLYAEPRSFLDAVHPEDRELVLAEVSDHARGCYECEYRIIQPDGTIRWIHDRGFPIRDESGNLRYMTGVARDITDLKEAQQELSTYTKRLEQSNQALQDFASIASHDMQEPLRKVISFGRIIEQKYGESIGDEGKDFLDRMLNATDRMQTLLKSLLDYSRVTTSAEPFNQVDLGVIVGEVLSDLEVGIERTGGKVHVSNLPTVEADPTQMRQLFQNLIGNALKFHKEGEKPFIDVRGTSSENGITEIVVADNGIGFDEKYLDRIFAPFQRLHGLGAYEGTGMGLAICKKIVERHGGSITARSSPGHGAIFTVALPKMDREAPGLADLF